VTAAVAPGNDQVGDELLARCLAERIEPPTAARVDRNRPLGAGSGASCSEFGAGRHYWEAADRGRRHDVLGARTPTDWWAMAGRRRRMPLTALRGVNLWPASHVATTTHVHIRTPMQPHLTIFSPPPRRQIGRPSLAAFRRSCSGGYSPSHDSGSARSCFAPAVRLAPLLWTGCPERHRPGGRT